MSIAKVPSRKLFYVTHSKAWFALDIAFFKYIEVCHECSKEGISTMQLNVVLHRSPPRSKQETCPAPQLSYAPSQSRPFFEGTTILVPFMFVCFLKIVSHWIYIACFCDSDPLFVRLASV